MGSLTVRGIDEAVKDGLRLRAARNGVSMEAEVREILADAVRSDHGHNVAEALREALVPFGGITWDDE